MNIPKITDDLIALQRSYSSTFRVLITEERYRLVESGSLTDYTFDTEALREPLIEHVGHLPIIASYLHQYIAHKDDVDLGRVLTILSIHDIGETVVGDMLTYRKTEAHAQSEVIAAKKILPKYLYAYFEEMEARETLDAKFAKSVDSLGPILHDMTFPPKILGERYKYLNFNVDKIIAKKQSHFDWDPVLQQMFGYLAQKYRVIEQQFSID
jgi:5'-deoxynucleotidase YfbR-like HD superfamily hydrolase